MSDNDQCPVCQTPLPRDTNASDSHVATCIENHMQGDKGKAHLPPTNYQHFPVQESESSSNMSSSAVLANSTVPEEDQCPICHISLLSKGVGESDATREAHVMACIDSIESHEPSKPKGQDFTPPDSHAPAGTSSQPSEENSGFFSKASRPRSQVLDSKNGEASLEAKRINDQREYSSAKTHIIFLGHY